MDEEKPSPKTTLLVVLGASQFPKSSEITPNEAFLHSAERIKKYFLDDDGFSLPKNNIIDLFNDKRTNTQIDRSLRDFLTERKDELEKEDLKIKDIIIYYVGHGGFKDKGNDYFLALCDTQDDDQYFTSYEIERLATNLKNNARFTRKYIILDSCFSAAAFSTFQTSPLSVAEKKIRDHFPKEGTVLFCASGPKDPAKVPPNQFYTMFSGALIDALQQGKKDQPEYISISTLGDLTKELIEKKFPDNMVRPELHSPGMREGDIAHLPLFPNPARRKDSLKEVVTYLEEMVNNQKSIQLEHETKINQLSNGLQNFSNRLITLESQVEKIDTNKSSLISSQSPNWTYHGLTKKEWDSIPSYEIVNIQKYKQRRLISYIWLAACLLICSTTWACFIIPRPDNKTSEKMTSLNTAKSTIIIDRYYLDSTIFMVTGIMTLISFILLLPSFRVLSSSEAKAKMEDDPWEKYEIVVRANRMDDRITLIGFQMNKYIFTFSTILYFITFTSIWMQKSNIIYDYFKF